MTDISDKLVLFIDVANLVICGEGKHGYDGRLHAHCPNDGSAERVHIEQWIGRLSEPQGRAVEVGAIPVFESSPCRIFLAEER